MRILLTSPTYPPFNSGLGNAVAQQATSLARAGHTVVVATSGTERGSRLDPAGVRVEFFLVSGADSWLQPIRGDRDVYVEFLRGTAWDVVLLNAWQNWATDLALLHLDELSGRKLVYSHCISTNVFFFHQPVRSLIRYLAWRPYWWRLPRVMRQLDGVLFLAGKGSDSRFDDLRLARRCGASWQVISNSLSGAALEALVSPPLAWAERNRLMAVGSYHWQKGFDFVLRAYAASSLCNRVPLHFFGQQHSRYSRVLASLAQELGLNHKFVTFHEGVSGDQLVAEYNRSRLVLTGSHTECQPLALIDASATGTPFIARATGCTGDMPGGLGVRDWREMAHCIDNLANDLTRWRSLSEAAYSAARDIYHPDHVARKLVSALAGEACPKNGTDSLAGGSAVHSPLLSVALPVFNGGAKLRPAVLSIIQQTFVDWELLLIDDGSTDGAVAGIADIDDPRVRIICDGQNQGLAVRLNQAIDLARGALFARMDGDDISHPQRFAKQVELLQADTSVDLVGTQCLTICEKGEIVGVLPGRGSHWEICRRPWLGFYLPHPTWMGRIEWFRLHRYSLPAHYCCEDQELLLRTHKVSQFRLIEQLLLAYRLRDRIHWRKAMRTRLAWHRVQRRYFLGRGEFANAVLATVAFVLRVGKDSLAKAMGLACGWDAPPFARSHVSIPEYELWKEVLNRLRGGRDA